MTDREKVIEELMRLHGSKETMNLISNTIALLKEQEPLPVSEGKVNKCTCGHEINRYWHPKFCGFCGKQLIWYRQVVKWQ